MGRILVTKTADAVIIGGGIIGVSVAFYLARAKFGKIIVLEKERFLGSGSTAKAAGGIRAQFSSKVNIEMSMLSERVFVRFKEETGWDALFDKVGYMFLLSDEQSVADFTKSYELQRSLGLKVRLLKPDEIPDYAPDLRRDGILLATFCEDDGLGDPYEFLSGYEHACRRDGVEFALQTELTAINCQGGRISGVSTTGGDIDTEVVINCAGPFGGQVGTLAGVQVAVKPYPRQCVTTGELDFIKGDFPMVVDVRSGLYMHKESKGLLLGWGDKERESSFDVSIDPDYTDAILERALELMPRLETAEIANQWSGLYETTPDHTAILGQDDNVNGLFHTTGFSGHGFMHAPAAGILTSEILTGKKLSIDISSLSPGRFAKGSVIAESNVI